MSPGCPENYSTLYNIVADSAFLNIKDDPEFIAVVQKMKKNSRPCEFDPRYKKFDFFIGLWDVYIGKNYDNKVAVDSVVREVSGCSIKENFR